MRTTDERLAAAKRRAEEIKRQERSRRSRIAAVSGAAACLAAILGLALAMPSVTARFSGADYYGGMTASLFTGESLGYLLVGLLAFALNYIPNIGSVLAAIPPILQVLVFGGLYEALVVLAGYLIVNLVFGNILEPRVMGRGLGLSTLVVFLSLIFWGWLLGPVGMLLSVPLTIIAKIALEQTSGGQSIAFLLSDVSKE